jgi:hypothetical protein
MTRAALIVVTVADYFLMHYAMLLTSLSYSERNQDSLAEGLSVSATEGLRLSVECCSALRNGDYASESGGFLLWEDE